MPVQKLPSSPALLEALKDSFTRRSEGDAAESALAVMPEIVDEMNEMRRLAQEVTADDVEFCVDQQEIDGIGPNGLVEVWYRFNDGREGGFAFQYKDLLPFLQK